jgi:hypothetical protein
LRTDEVVVLVLRVGPLGEAPQGRDRSGHDRPDLADYRHEQRNQVRRSPLAGHVGLPEADLAVHREASRERVIVLYLHDWSVRVPEPRAILELQAQPAVFRGTADESLPGGGS